MDNDDIAGRLSAIERKLERVWSQIETISGRLSSYLGDGVASTYLRNGNLIYVNANDFGSPANFIDGGEYEPDNLQVLLSFVTEDTIFVDIGANLGFFSLVIGDRMRRAGRVLAFEPQPRMVELFERSIHHNGLRGIVQLYPFGLSDAAWRGPLWAPKAHLGGATLAAVPETARGGFDEIEVETRRFDDVVGDEFVCDLVKIDVEGHELSVLRGMSGVIGRSPRIKLLIEKLEAGDDLADGLAAYFASFGMNLHGVIMGGLTEPLDIAQLRAWRGYVLAARPAAIDNLDRRGFSIYPAQLQGGSSRLENGRLVAAGPGLMAHGPYWSLPRGTWRLKVLGDLQGEIFCAITERFGHQVVVAALTGPGQTADFIIEHDLIKFECAFHGAAGARLAIERLDWRRIG